MSRSMALDGLTDAVGFLAGALAGFALGRALGFDLLAPGYGAGAIVGILLVGVGGGGGVQLARALRARRRGSARDGDPR